MSIREVNARLASLEQMDDQALYVLLQSYVERDSEISQAFPVARGLVDEIGEVRSVLRARGLPAAASEIGY